MYIYIYVFLFKYIRISIYIHILYSRWLSGCQQRLSSANLPQVMVPQYTVRKNPTETIASRKQKVVENQVSFLLARPTQSKRITPFFAFQVQGKPLRTTYFQKKKTWDPAINLSAVQEHLHLLWRQPQKLFPKLPSFQCLLCKWMFARL